MLAVSCELLRVTAQNVPAATCRRKALKKVENVTLKLYVNCLMHECKDMLHHIICIEQCSIPKMLLKM